jgi:Putative DNA-binding domain
VKRKSTKHSDLRQWQEAVVKAVASTKEPLAKELKLIHVTGATAGARINIYRHAYVSRIVGSLKDDFPLLQRLQSEKQFQKLAKLFLLKRGSSRKSLTDLSWDFANFIRQTSISQKAKRALESDLLALEEGLLVKLDSTQISELSFSKRVKFEIVNRQLWLMDSQGSIRLNPKGLSILKSIRQGTTLSGCANRAHRIRMNSKALFELFRALSSRGLLQQTKLNQ